MKTSEAIEFFGGVKTLATALKCWPNEVYRWGEYPPKGKQFEIEVKTAGELKAEGIETPQSRRAQRRDNDRTRASGGNNEA